MNEYFTLIETQFGVPIWIFVTVLAWSMAWNLLALWKSAKKGALVWFIAMGLFNTRGILPILYIFVFSKMKKRGKSIGKKKGKK